MKVDAEGFKKVPILEKKGIHIENYLKEHQHEYYVWQYGHGSNAYIHHSLPIYLREARGNSQSLTATMPDFVPHVLYLLYCGVTNRAILREVSFLPNEPALNNQQYYAFTPDPTSDGWYNKKKIIQLFSTRFLSKQNTANSCP